MIKRLIKLGHKAMATPHAPNDAQWYLLAGEWADCLDLDFDLAPRTAAGVIAALSPLQSWQAQVKFTPPSIAAWQSYNSPAAIRGPGFFSNKDKAHRILSGENPSEVLSGDKVTRFYRNLCGDLSCVTIDRHMLTAAGWRKALTPGAYRRIEFAFRMAAEKFDLQPAEFQALVWNYWRRNEARNQRHNNQ